MFDRFNERRRDRRRRHSFRGHYKRLKEAGRLPQIGLAIVASLIIAGVSFGQCSDPTGPEPSGSEPAPISKPQGVPQGPVTSTASTEKTATTIFAIEIMPSINVCSGEVLTEPSGEGTFTYTHFREDNGGGTHFNYQTRSKRRGKFAKDSKGYSGEKYMENGHFMAKSSPHHQHVVEHVVVKEEGEPAEVSHRNEKREWDEGVEYTLIATENPVTGDWMMTATAAKINPSCVF